MARRRNFPPVPQPRPVPVAVEVPEKAPLAAPFWTGTRVVGAVVVLLAAHWALAVISLLGENPTVDEVAHLPAGVTYWQKGTFKLYHHNPPLVKLAAALPVVASRPVTAPLYETTAWSRESQSTFGELFARANIPDYLELFARARLVMPWFSVLGGLVVFTWSRRLYGSGGGVLSLALWCLCPNVLAHARLVTSDVAAASIGAGATFLFVRYQHRPGWGRAALAGVALGLAQLTKFSLILLYGFWPLLALARFWLEGRREGWPLRALRTAGHAALVVALSVLVIDAGYGLEKVGRPLGSFEFASRSLTVPVPPGLVRPLHPNEMLEKAWAHRVNRFRGTALQGFPVPLPLHYVLGFDEQKLETEGLPTYWFDKDAPPDDSITSGYTVYLDGELRQSGWWYYYLATLAYKVPEGTIVLVLLGVGVLIVSKRSRAPAADELAVLTLPVGVVGAMSFLTNICLGLRYILPVFPYAYVATGRLAPWVAGLTGRARVAALAVIAGSLLGDVASVASIHPHYLAYFNAASGGPDRGAEHLIDSNLDWGQDLVTLERWLKANHPGRPVGLAYFGQINPSLLKLRGGGFDWFLPFVPDGLIQPMSPGHPGLVGPAPRLTPGLYAVSATVRRGLPWRFYDSASLTSPRLAWQAAWSSRAGAFSYFGRLTPVARVGHSIDVYEVTEADCSRLAGLGK